ncbi:MAG: hypothetical protein WDN01_00070 [Rhizomicrobium sp.]
MTIFTIGHSTRTITDFVALLAHVFLLLLRARFNLCPCVEINLRFRVPNDAGRGGL